MRIDVVTVGTEKAIFRGLTGICDKLIPPEALAEEMKPL